MTARLWRASPVLAVAILGAALGGCSYQIGSLLGKDRDKSEITGSVGLAKAPRQPAPTSDLPPDSDLVFARAAVQDVLSGDGTETSMPWENPASGARGTVTPITIAYSQDGFLCRDFLASYVREGSESWLQGEACRLPAGTWEVKNLRRWKHV